MTGIAQQYQTWLLIVEVYYADTAGLYSDTLQRGQWPIQSFTNSNDDAKEVAYDCYCTVGMFLLDALYAVPHPFC